MIRTLTQFSAGNSYSSPPLNPCRDTQERFRVPQIDKGPLPAWAQAVCSPLAVCLEPSTAAQKADTIKYAVALVRYHTEVLGTGDQGHWELLCSWLC